jgi:GNAT superfamily N-acetyltransferase
VIPDEPRWVEAHGIAADPRGWRRSFSNGFALGHDVAKLIVADGDVDVAAIAREFPQHAILVVTDALAGALSPIRTPVRAILHTLPEPDAMPDYEGAIPLPADAVLPDALAAELGDARGRGEIWSAYVDGEPAAFAYAPWRSERWFDVSVDVIPGARQLGLGTIVAAAMIRHERAAGREPVWGADEDNHASLRLAARLGFVECDRIWVAP